jgi:4'-phosphopantetheinyl transferase EntD
VIERLLPAGVVAVDTRTDDVAAVLFREERALLGQAVERRRQEFTTARACARAALARLGLPAVPILAGERGEPLWPAGIVGSITHCNGYRACALAPAAQLLALGIDAEPNAPLPDGVLADIVCAEELSHLRALAVAAPHVRWDRLLFSAKESIYKAWFPLTHRTLGFEDAQLSFVSAPGAFPTAAGAFPTAAGARSPVSMCGCFSARLRMPSPIAVGVADHSEPPASLSEHGALCDGRARLRGRWMLCDGLLLTSATIASSGGCCCASSGGAV